MDPYNNNPFKADEKEIRNERDANRELAKTVTDDVIETIHGIFGPMHSDKHSFWKFGE